MPFVMVAEAAVFVDVDGLVRHWLRETVHSIAGRGFFGAAKGRLPQISLSRLAGPDEACVYTFHVWGDTHEQAAKVAAELATAIGAAASYTHDSARIHGAAVQNMSYRPDPRSDRPRFVVDATFAVTAA